MEFLNGSNLAPMASIVVLCFLVGQTIKTTKINNAFIPAVVGAVGLLLGIGGHFGGVEALKNMELYDAMAVGVLSGFASTGIHNLIQTKTKVQVVDSYEENDI